MTGFKTPTLMVMLWPAWGALGIQQRVGLADDLRFAP